MRKAAALLLLLLPLLAYRPFYSTDADVEEKGALEVELGLFTLERAGEERSLISPFVILNLGLGKRIELVTELKGIHRLSGWKPVSSSFEDLNLFIKGVLREGALQGKEGLSLAFEGGFLLPTLKGQGTGAELLGIVSGRAGSLTWHFNAGGFVEREESCRGFFSGFILESPPWKGARVVGEVFWEKAEGEEAEASFLVGVIYEKGDIAFDLALRHGIASDFFALTAGLTFGFRIW